METHSKETPAIELFMYSLRQEYPVDAACDVAVWQGTSPDGTGQEIRIPKDRAARPGESSELQSVMPLHVRWTARWAANNSGVAQMRHGTSAIRMALSREESFGGLIHDPVHDKVYKVNAAGLRLFRRIQDDVRCGKGLASIEPSKFTAFLSEVGLWK